MFLLLVQMPKLCAAAGFELSGTNSNVPFAGGFLYPGPLDIYRSPCWAIPHPLLSTWWGADLWGPQDWSWQLLGVGWGDSPAVLCTCAGPMAVKGLPAEPLLFLRLTDPVEQGPRATLPSASGRSHSALPGKSLHPIQLLAADIACSFRPWPCLAWLQPP